MFKSKKDRYVVELAIKFNLSEIDKWLDKSGKIKDIKKPPKDFNGDDVWLSYYIDVLPNGQSSDMYYHRKKGVVSANYGGIDYLKNVDKNIEYFLKNSKIERLSWSGWREFIGLDVNQKLILNAPVEEIVELQVNGVLKNGGSLRDKEKKIKVPVSFDDQNNPKKFMEAWRISPSARSIIFSNALGSISVSNWNDEVEY